MRSLRSFLSSGHLPTLLTALLYFDLCFAAWVLNAAMAPFIAADLRLSHAQTGTILAVPVAAGALLRLPFGVVAQHIGLKRAAELQMALVVVGLAMGRFWASSFGGVVAMGVVLGIAGASFGVALSLGSGWYPPHYKGLAMGIAGAGNSGAVIAMLLAPPLARAYGWREVYGAAMVPLALALLLLHAFAREPPGRASKPMRAYLDLLLDRDAWTLSLVYAVTFGGYIGLTSVLPTLFHDQYGVPKESIGSYATGIVLAASALRVTGGWLADRVGGIRLLHGGLAIVAASAVAAACLPARIEAMVAVLVVAFAALGAGNGAVFQLVPLRFSALTPVATSLVGEVGALAGGALPVAMGLGKAWVGSWAIGFLLLVALAALAALALAQASRRWTARFVGPGGRVLAGESVGAAHRPAPP